jgi:hypothetical protein
MCSFKKKKEPLGRFLSRLRFRMYMVWNAQKCGQCVCTTLVISEHPACTPKKVLQGRCYSTMPCATVFSAYIPKVWISTLWTSFVYRYINHWPSYLSCILFCCQLACGLSSPIASIALYVYQEDGLWQEIISPHPSIFHLTHSYLVCACSSCPWHQNPLFCILRNSTIRLFWTHNSLRACLCNVVTNS